MSELVPFAAAFLTLFGLTPLVKWLAVRVDFVDRPSARRFHDRVVPLGGGLAIAAGVAVGLLVGGQAGGLGGVPVLAGFAFITLLGLYDDLRGAHPALKLAGQITAALLVVFGTGLHVSQPLGVFTIPAALLWVVGLMNAFNFLDNMDGILAGIAALCGVAFWLLGLGTGIGATGAAAAVAGAALGFLVYNFAPARIFMGDAGSMALGYLLSAISLTMIPADPAPVPLAAVVLVMAYPIFDITFVTVTRIYGRRKIYLGGRDHSSHRLNNLLMNPRLTALVIYAMTAAVAGLGVLLGHDPSPHRAVVLGGSALCFLIVLGLGLARSPIS